MSDLPKLNHNGLRIVGCLALSLLMQSCGPIGHMKRTIHPVTHLASRTTQVQGQAGSATSPTPRSRPGLPNHCSLQAVHVDRFCLVCKDGKSDIERCYNFKGTIDPSKNCFYTHDHIKCLSAKPPFALNLAIKGSLEKALQENIRYWKQGLLAVAAAHEEDHSKEDLEEALEWTESLVRVLTTSQKDPQWVELEFQSLLDRALPPAKEELKKSLLDLEKEKESGQLKLQQVLDTSRKLLQATGTSDSILTYWGALSVEGLEEPD